MPRGFRERGGAWVLVQSVLMALVLVLGPLCPGTSLPGWRWPLAITAGVLGVLFGIAGAWVLGRNRTIFPHPNPGSELIQHGIYRWVRHPLYTSLALLATAWAVGWGSWAAGVAGLIQTVVLDLKSRREEVWLRNRFPEYDRYARRVRRLVPGVY
jgi:protein-S-isoprenylcysteine O-methyltransferase Ste14